MHKVKRIWQRRYYLLPLIIFIGVAGFLWQGLLIDPKVLPSALLNKPLPNFQASVLEAPQQIMTTKALQGKVGILHVWASWCQTCLVEHALWMQLATFSGVTLYGIDYRDDWIKAKQWLELQGDPYLVTLSDPDGRLGMDLGVQGTPETFIFDKSGIIRYKFQGPLTLKIWQKKLLPLIQQLKKT